MMSTTDIQAIDSPISLPESIELFHHISELVDYLRDENPTMQSLVQFVAIRTFAPLNVSSFFISQVNSEGEISPQWSYGFSDEVMRSWNKSYITDQIPTADALRNNSMLWLCDKDNWDVDYPHLRNFLIQSNASCFVTAPMNIKGSYMSVAGIVMLQTFAPDSKLKSFVETVFSLIGMHASTIARRDVTADPTEKLSQILGRRQREILKLIADGMTNAQIGSELGFSESTIRQDTMKIYEAFGVTGRKEAIAKYRALVK